MSTVLEQTEMNVLFIIVILIASLSSGCTGLHKSTVTKTPDGVTFMTRKPGMLKYKDKDIEAEMDTRKSGVLEDILKIYTLKVIGDND